MTSIETQFQAAVEQVKTTPPAKNTSQDLQLKMYALFKQANEGDVKGSTPKLNPVARAKHKAWAGVKGMSQEDAMRAYIAEVEGILPPQG